MMMPRIERGHENIYREREFAITFPPLFHDFLKSFTTTWQFWHHGGTMMGQHEPISLNGQVALCV
jgi:hypothetical protein